MTDHCWSAISVLYLVYMHGIYHEKKKKKKHLYICNQLISPALASSPILLSIPHGDSPQTTLLESPASVCSTNKTQQKNT